MRVKRKSPASLNPAAQITSCPSIPEEIDRSQRDNKSNSSVVAVMETSYDITHPINKQANGSNVHVVLCSNEPVGVFEIDLLVEPFYFHGVVVILVFCQPSQGLYLLGLETGCANPWNIQPWGLLFPADEHSHGSGVPCFQ
mmetsp:Transcript_6847/g.12931  ORF Transcript_6847/g.12931 Transcript_6847/m.12931 type:complete len:141 (-) Transcript_6847:9-431(-)